MIDFSRLQAALADGRTTFASATPYPHIAIDDACDGMRLRAALDPIAQRLQQEMAASGDLIFARNKFVDTQFEAIAPELAELRQDLLSPEFAAWLGELVGEPLFLDPQFYGGGLHAGGEGSFLDMHTDFSYHPQQLTWKRQLNILLYLNVDWHEHYGGQLLMQHVDRESEEPVRVAPAFNRLVIMESSGVTLHGYDPIAFPAGSYRLSIASYAYREEQQRSEDVRSTVWYPRSGGVVKRSVGQLLPRAIQFLRSLRRR